MIDKKELSEEIFKLGRMIISRKRIEENNNNNINIMKFHFKNNLDKKIFSNDDKRESEALKQPAIKKAVDDLRDYHYETMFLELEYEHKLRLFNI